jgi:cytoskeletal protein CcmA (bactofilin family)
MKTSIKLLSAFILFTLLATTVATPALAFDGRTGENVTIAADETIEDDVYVSASTFVLDGNIKGDLIVVGQNITINGTVDGDLIAAGENIIINGTVTDDARIAGAALQLGAGASVGGDLVSAGASLETRKKSTVEGELVVGAGQALLAGDVTGDVLAGTGSLELGGQFGGDVQANVGEAEQGAGGPPPSMYMPNTTISFPQIAPGFTINKDAKIKGNLEYTQTKDIKIPENVVGGKITRTEPVLDTSEVIVPPTQAELALTWALNLVRSIVTLLIFGLLLGWLAPAFTKTLMDKVQEKPAANVGWGIVAYAAFFFAILIIIVAMVIGGIVFGALTLGSISGTIIWVGLISIFGLTTGFILVTSFLTKIIVSWLGGKMILARINPALAEHKVWPLLLGVVLVALVIALPFVGWLFGLIVLLLGLGGFWVWMRERWSNRNAASMPAITN